MNRFQTMGLALALTQLLACSGGGPADCDQLPIVTYPDADGDGFGGDADAEETCGTPAGRTQSPGDCDDTVSNINILALEICDGIDNDCDGDIDDGLAVTEWYADQDGDGYGTASSTTEACVLPDGYSASADDCDDSAPANHPGGIEVCDGLDNDCDGDIDQDDETLDLNSMITFYADIDGDTFGDPNISTQACQGMGNMVTNADDCDDGRASVNPLAAERCSQRDDDCDGLIDEADPSLDPALLTTYYADNDGDGFGDIFSSMDLCFHSDDTSLNSDDCDDSNPLLGLPSDWYVDADADGYGSGLPVEFGVCVPSDGSLAPGATDCDDGDPDLSPGTPEICGDGVDQNCTGADQACIAFLELAPQSGNIIETDDPFWANKGYQFNTLQDFTITGGAWWIVLPPGGYVSLSIYDDSGALLVRGTQGYGSGLGGEEWYQSDLDYDFIAGETYTASFYTNLAQSSLFDRYDNASYGYDVDGLIGDVTHRSSSVSGDYASEEFPDYLGNSWAAIQRLDVIPQ